MTDTHDTRDEHPEDGFTLVEVLVVMTIIAVMGTFIFLNLRGATDKSQIQKARTDIRTLEQAVELYRLDMNRYPESLSELVVAPRDAELAARFPKGGYLKFLEADPWGRDYVYTYPGEHGTFDIASLGADGVEGGEELNADITSWRR